MRDIIHEAMARALFVDAWANAMEEAGKLPGQCELMDVAPPTSYQALDEAKKLYFDIEKENDVHLDEFVPPGFTDDEDEWFSQEAAGKEVTIRLWDTEQARLFGHYLAMEALGHGVAWSDDNEKHGLEVPYYSSNIWPDIVMDEDDEDTEKGEQE